MKKFLKYAAALMAVAMVSTSFISCSKDEDEEVKNYDLTIVFQRSGDLADATITEGKLTISSGSATETKSVSDLSQAIVVNKPQGSYNITFSGKIADEATAIVTGTAKAELYANQTVTVNLQKGTQSSLVFKTIYSTGGAQYYVLDSYVEIVNNSDEVQYLDQLILACPLANQSAKSAWQETYPDMYNCGQGTVLAFPGSGKDYPIQPGESIILADQAMNHKLAYGDDESKKDEYAKSPDLSNANWEKYYGNGDADNEAVPNMEVVFSNNQHMKMWAFGVMGRAYMLAKLPDGVTPQQYAADENNFKTTPGTTATTLFMMLPSKYVLDAVEIYANGKAAEDNYPFFLEVNDAKGIEGSPTYVGQCVRRKVAKIANGRVYYQDTNNSSNDFKNCQDNTPGVTPTTVD